MLQTKNEIEIWLEQYNIHNYMINDDLIVDVNNSVNIIDKKLTEIPVKFGVVSGNFILRANKLTELPHVKEVKGTFSIANNKISSLINFPIVHGAVYLHDNLITSLEGLPLVIKDWFSISHNPLTSLKHCPSEIKGDFLCSSIPLKSFEYMPKKIGGDLHLEKILLNIMDSNLSLIEMENFIIFEPCHDKKQELTQYYQTFPDKIKDVTLVMIPHNELMKYQKKCQLEQDLISKTEILRSKI